jgi:hypothetical protein
MAVGNLDQTTILLIALIVVLVLVAAWWYMYGRQPPTCKANAKTPPAHNGKSGKPFTGHHSNWHLGSEDSGHGGSMHRDPTVHHLATHARANPHNTTAAKCGPGQSAVTHTGPGGVKTQVCVSSAAANSMQCGGNWDPESVAQLHSLSTMGSLDVTTDPHLAHAAAGRRGHGSAPPGISVHSSTSA